MFLRLCRRTRIMGINQWRGTSDENQHWKERRCRTLRRFVSKKSHNYCSTGNRTAELNIHFEAHVWRESHRSNIHGRAAIAKSLVTESNAQMRKRWYPVKTMKTGHQTTGNARVILSDESSLTLFLTSGRIYVWRTPKEAHNKESLFPRVKHAEVLWWFGEQYRGAVPIGPIITFHSRITAKEYVNRLCNQVNPMIQTLVPNNNAIFQDDNAPIHTAGTVQS
jgi:hypothetical protein